MSRKHLQSKEMGATKHSQRVKIGTGSQDKHVTHVLISQEIFHRSVYELRNKRFACVVIRFMDFHEIFATSSESST